jgi:hypothetical protein
VWVVLAVVLVALVTVLIAIVTVLIALIVSVALTVLIVAGIDAAGIIAAADIVAVEDIAAEEDSFRSINGNPLAYREESLQSSLGLFFIGVNIRDKLQYIR